MSDEPHDPSPVDEPSDLRAVEGLGDAPQREPGGADAVEPRETKPTAETATATGPEPGDHYDVHSLPRGTQLGRFVLLGNVRSGTDDVAYAAYDPDGDRKVSLKLFHPGGDRDRDDDEAWRMGMAQRAQAAAKISHPCVEQILETGVYGPWIFLATEFLDGIDVAHWMEARDDPFPWPEVLRVFREAGRGLAAAHAQGIVHHDFKPSNIIMGKEGRLVVVDFGLAAEIEEEDDDVEISQLRSSLQGRETPEDEIPLQTSGTAAYMAPEKHLTGYGDAQSDQFSFCVSLYEALYGERPFSGNRPRAIALEAAKHKVRPAPEGSTVPQWLRDVVLRGLSPRPDDRFPGMEALLRELARDPAASRRRWGWGAGLVVALAVTGGLVALQLEADTTACEEAKESSALATAWDDERRETLAQAFTATGRRWADPTWGYTESKLDAWADEWRDLSVRACRATRVWEDASERHYQLRLACLDRQLAGFEATLEALGAIEGPMLDHAHVLARDLVPPRRCVDTETLFAQGLPPEEQRDEVEALHRELSGLEARLALGQPGPVLEQIAAIELRAEATADRALAARVQLLRGRAELADGRPEAERSLHQATAAALRSGHPQLASHSLLARMQALMAPQRAGEVSALGDYVEAVVDRKHLTWLRPSLEVARGDAEQLRRRPAEALAHYYAAAEHEDIRPDPDQLRLVPAWLGQSDVLVDRGDLEDAVGPLHSALEVIRSALGPHHPAAIEVLQRLGWVERTRGKPAEARTHLEQALQLALASETYGKAERAQLEGELGMLLALEGEQERALPHLERALDARGGAAAATSPDVFRLGLAVAQARLGSGNALTARELLQAILAHFTSVPFPVGTEDTAQPTTAERVEAEQLLATLWWEAGEQSRAQGLARATLSRLDGDSAAHEVYRTEVEGWLAKHVPADDPPKERPAP